MVLSTKSFIRTLLTFACTLSLSHGALAQDSKEEQINWTKGGKWSDLTKYIGTYDYAALLDEKEIQDKLKERLKGEDIDLKTEFAVQAPIGFANDCLILKGNQVKKGDTNRAYMEICTYSGDINIAIYERGGVQVLSEANEYQLLSDSLRQWVYLQNDDTPAMTSKPENVMLNQRASDKKSD